MGIGSFFRKLEDQVKGVASDFDDSVRGAASDLDDSVRGAASDADDWRRNNPYLSALIPFTPENQAALAAGGAILGGGMALGGLGGAGAAAGTGAAATGGGMSLGTLGLGLGSIGASLYGANQAKKGMNAQIEAGDRAAALEAQSAADQLKLQREIWEKQQADYKPYLEQGTWGINRLGDLMRNQTPAYGAGSGFNATIPMGMGGVAIIGDGGTRKPTPIGGGGGQYYQSPASNSQSTYISGGNDPFYDYQGQRNIAARPTNPQSTANAVAQNLKNFSGVDWYGSPGSAAPLGFGLGGTNIFGGGTSNTSQPQPQPQQQYRNNANGGQLNNPFDTYLASKGLAGGRFDTSNPAYQFQLQQGQQALDRSAAASGMGASGAQIKAAQKFGQGLASQEYDKQYNRASGEFGDYFNRLAGLAQGGQQAVGSMAQAGSQYASNAGNTFANLSNAQTGILGQQANARASGYTANANAINGGLNSLTNLYALNKIYG